MLDDKRITDEKEEANEQIRYLNWYSELRYLKRALADMPRMREEYRHARRVCLGYRKDKVSFFDLEDALNAAFMMERCSVITQKQVQAATDAYLNKTAKEALTAWEKEQKIVYGPERLDPEIKLSPLTVARLYAQLISKNERDAGYDAPKLKAKTEDLALFFGVQAEKNNWTPSAKRLFRGFAEGLIQKFLLENSNAGTLRSLVWKEMHDILIKENPTKLDHVKFGLVGTVGQRMGFDLEEIGRAHV